MSSARDLVRLAHQGSRVSIAPWRGAIVTSFFARGRELLYLDDSTFVDEKANVRGGVPVLFPTPGKLVEDTWSRAGRTGRLKQHGFARNLPWEVVEQSTDAARLRLTSSDETRASYPWDFVFELGFALQDTELSIELDFHNRGDEPMPFGAGFHPYFRIADSDKSRATVPTNATRAFDNAAKSDVSLTRIDLARSEVDLHLHGHIGGALELFDGPRHIAVKSSPELSQWVVWTLASRDFVCLEPWTGPGNAMNSGVGLITLEPSASMKMRVSIDCLA